MKKFFAAVFAALALVLAVAAFSGCATDYSGTYKFHSLRIDDGNTVLEYFVGQEYDGGQLGDDYAVLELNKDNTWSISSSMDVISYEGKWSVCDDGILLEFSDLSYGKGLVCEADGTFIVLHFERLNMTFRLKK